MPESTRRNFLAQTAGLAGAAMLYSLAKGETLPELEIARVETFPLSYPTAGRFKFFEGPWGEQLGHRTVIVKTTAADGSVGWGQAVPSNNLPGGPRA